MVSLMNITDDLFAQKMAVIIILNRLNKQKFSAF